MNLHNIEYGKPVREIEFTPYESEIQTTETGQPHKLPDPDDAMVAVVGLGYVGLPLVCGFSHKKKAIGFDINEKKIGDLEKGTDETGEVSAVELEDADVQFTSDATNLREADTILVCVPTPVNSRNKPDYKPLLAASRTIGQHLKRGAVVVFESTVDPGTTENICLPVLEEASGMTEGEDFHLGYSPERINPADPSRKYFEIKKIVAGRRPEVTDYLISLYSKVIKAELFPASSIKVAEAAKILENTQRDVNIALMNEMMMLYDKMDIRAADVLAAAGTKWNFHHYRPGMVGGHCIAVDPYYLIDSGRRQGLSMELVSASRSVNEQTPFFIAEKLEELFEKSNRTVEGKRVLVLGRTFKENCPDTRNSKAYKMMDYLWAQGAEVISYDPVAEDTKFEGGRGVTIIDDVYRGGIYHAIIITLLHDEFRENLNLEALMSLAPRHAPFIDMRGNYESDDAKNHFHYWRP